MSGRPEEGLYGNVESQSSTVSQGGRRRTRSEFESDTDYSSTTRIRLEGIRRPQWTMSSTVEDILLEGSTNRTEMRLNDFLRSKLGGTAAVDEDHNVTMEAFVRRTNAYVQDQQLLEEILDLPAYQVLKMELNERERELKYYWRLFISFITRVYSLSDNGGNMKERIRSLLLQREKLNAALTEVQKKENSKARGRKSKARGRKKQDREEEKARREEEKARREEEKSKARGTNQL
ncbi:putative retrotransposon hot spot protein (RHS,) [Trypanosoma cruzi]|uniref:Putative retrotransposon hot spot protein (RHS,) n=1 Tax=Trypanosoma cruzi TaxID=5693 RepID=A0A2V2UHN9_TRYCR|nr:putative retrotransposon hot spot protein (RHS,) [Trypanosoma cruzi]